MVSVCIGCAGIKKRAARLFSGTTTTEYSMERDQSDTVPIPLSNESENNRASTDIGEPAGSLFKEPGPEEHVTLEAHDPNNPKEKRYFLTMIDSDLKAVLLSFSKGSPYNIILDSDVTGRVTMDLKDVTLEDALDKILTPLNYTYRKEGNFIHVSRPKIETRIFALNYLATIREGKTIIEAKTPGGVSGASAEPTKIVNQEKTDLWDEIEKGLKHLLTEEGTFFVNKMASLVIVTDYSTNLRNVAEFLETVEGSIQRQVLIEATIAEVLLSDDYQMGLDWSYLVGSETGTSFLGDNTKFALDTSGLMTTSVFEFSFQYKDLTALLNAIAEQGTMNIISRPRLTTLNNQKAIIKVGTEEVYFERETETSTTTTTETYTVKFFTVGLLLDVTPQISAEDEITLHIHPVISEKVDERPYPIGGGTIPIVNIRESSSVVKVKSGHTVVLTGLMQEKANKTAAGVPVLMEIPFLGNLFRYTRNEKIKTELVITLTPRIIYGQEMHELSDDMLKGIGKHKHAG
ncbi:MAG: secretin and TonB N-terminal domain-containing protein [bacterium]